MVVFLAPDEERLAELDQAARSYLAWKEIAEKANELNLTPQQLAQATDKRDQFGRTVDDRLALTYQWVLNPVAPDPGSPFELEEEEIKEKLGPLMEEGAVMVLHCPPYGFLDKVMGDKSVGSTAILDLVKRYRPKVVLSGHVHEDRGVIEKDGTLFMNPGAAKDGYSALLDIGEVIKGTLLERVVE
ncbi:MAG TPA: hypothetical protein PKX52_06840 [Methanomassiliicoccaceae archaeon]|nr:hypothetical protein [Methanomassiliicoccaceae archaeon]